MTKQKLLTDLFQAYYDARQNKRNTHNALAFELNYERNLFQLGEDIINRSYHVGRSICFIVNRPVKREIFAADFRDRVAHHLLFNYLNPFCERLFIYDSYACRAGKGTSLGIRRANYFIRSGSQNYQKDCYILKLDIAGYFMSIDKQILFQKVMKIVRHYAKETGDKMDLLIYLLSTIIFNDPIKNFRLKGSRADWRGLPKNKSLFYARPNTGLPIGNLTSQLFGNIYLNDFDHFVLNKMAIRERERERVERLRYGRYVDDCLFVHPQKEYLLKIMPSLQNFLGADVKLKIHPRKIYLQHYSQGVEFLGVFIKPYRIYIKRRTKGNIYQNIKHWNHAIIKGDNKLDIAAVEKFCASINSYLGFLLHFNTCKLRQKVISHLSAYFWNYVYTNARHTKLNKRKIVNYRCIL